MGGLNIQYNIKTYPLGEEKSRNGLNVYLVRIYIYIYRWWLLLDYGGLLHHVCSMNTVQCSLMKLFPLDNVVQSISK